MFAVTPYISADTTGPTVTNCPSNTIQVTAPVGSQGVASWQEPFAVDSSGVAELVYQSDTPGSTFPLGTSPVAYVFADLYRNPTICLFFVRVTCKCHFSFSAWFSSSQQ